ncbi:MAG TPA: lipid-A-disaccharide synthase [Bacteroidales bacterium]|nr:lipid-A-disaccharide synthase [Bacteroidales bacterium]
MKYFIIAGEASGDLHGSNLITELLKTDPDAEIFCWGGDKMKKSGGQLLVNYKELAVMGFWEVIIKLGRIYKYLRKCRDQIRQLKPDLVILIDYPGFNLRIARYLNSLAIKVYYYISPKVWAWKKSRVKKIKEYVNRMYIIFPFEKEFFNEHNYEVHYFGNPLVETVEKGIKTSSGRKKFLTENNLEDKPVISLLPGSRLQEIKKILPVMVRICNYYPDYQILVAGIDTIEQSVYDRILDRRDIKVVYNDIYSLLVNSDAALVTSGTATLETAIAGVPQVVCYRTSRFSYLIARMMVKIRFISLVNLIMDKEIVKELIQNDLNEKKIVKELNTILPGGWKRKIMMDNYSLLRNKLSGSGATSRIAGDMYHSLKLVNNVN